MEMESNFLFEASREIQHVFPRSDPRIARETGLMFEGAHQLALLYPYAPAISCLENLLTIQ
jgi:hypothetical protein